MLRRNSLMFGLGFVFFAQLSTAQSNSDLDGKWATDCPKDRMGSNLIYTNFFSSSGTYRLQRDSHVDGACKEPFVTVENEGKFSLGKAFQTPKKKNAVEIDYTVSHYWLTPRQEGLVKMLNRLETCGINTWAINQPKDIAGIRCDGSHTLPKAGDKLYGVIQIEGTRLLIGNLFPEAINQITDRPKDVEEKHVFNKK